MTLRRFTLLILVAALGLAPFSAHAQQADPQEDEAPAPSEPEKEDEERPPDPEPSKGQIPGVYVPPSRGSVQVRVGAASRGEQPGLPYLEALAPAHVALTTQEQPVLWWYLGEPTDVRIDLVVIDDHSVAPLLEVTAPAGLVAGIHGLDLAKRGLRLEPDRVYQWFVALVPEPERRSRDVIASGAIRRVSQTPELESALAAAPPADRWMVYARNGVWYDALTGVSRRIEAGESGLRAQRSQLLGEGSLPRAAEWDRAESGVSP